MRVKFSEMLVQPTPLDRLKREVYFPTYLPYPHMLIPDMEKMQATLETLVGDVGLGDPGQKVLEGLAEKLKPYRRWQGIEKAPGVAAILKDELETGKIDKLVIFFVHKDTADELAEHLAAHGPVKIFAQSPQDKKDRAIERFTERKSCRVLLVHLSPDYQIPDLTMASNVVFVEAAWKQDVNVAALLRVANLRQTQNVDVRFAAMEGNIDRRLQKVLNTLTKTAVLAFLDDATKI